MLGIFRSIKRILLVCLNLSPNIIRCDIPSIRNNEHLKTRLRISMETYYTLLNLSSNFLIIDIICPYLERNNHNKMLLR